MNPGDKVWIFAAEEVKSFIFDGYQIDGTLCGHVDDNTRVLIVQPEKVPIFTTREELCEHYRKIFE